MQPQLISEKTCPFVQRAVLILKEKRVEHRTTYVDILDPPDWFAAKSPRGQTPLLEVENQVVLGPQAICEYLEEAFGATPLMPKDLLQRARARGWFPRADQLFTTFDSLQKASDEAAFREHRRTLAEALQSLDGELAGRLWLTGDGSRFGMADVAVAPLVTRTIFLRTWFSVDLLSHHHHVAAWVARLVARSSFQTSVPADFQDALLGRIRSAGGHLATLA